MSLAPAGWLVGLLSDMLWSSVSHPPLSKKAPHPFAFFLRTYKAWQLLGEGHAHFRGTKEPAMPSDFPAP